MMNISENNYWMRLALKEAQRSTGLTSPNPAVGAVIVRDGIVIARGRTRQVGGNHAERDALSVLETGEAKGATIYVTLEPCSTQGRSGACTDAIIDAGISRVVFCVLDDQH
jgi:diaminohydroxyphosphoribosylaminopyrimidine deaminase/5-amino-6-(5-phosphoribosylamino)uracil reductase